MYIKSKSYELSTYLIQLVKCLKFKNAKHKKRGRVPRFES